MSVSKKGRRVDKGSHSTDPNAVGYKRPPSRTRFMKGKSGNPDGRPKGGRNIANMTKDVLNRSVRARSGDEVLEMPAVEAIVRVLANKAAQGNSRATSLFNKLLEMAGFTSEMTDEERERRLLHLPRSRTIEEHDLLEAPARERDRQRYLAMAESDEATAEVPGDDGSAAEKIPPAIKVGDQLAAQGKFDEALAAYRPQLALCKTELTADSGNKTAQHNFRRAVARIGLLANTLLLAGDFSRALAIADEAIAEAASGFWIAPDLPYRFPSANTLWINLVRTCALMFLGGGEEARRYFLHFQTAKSDAFTSWETVILRDFVRLRRLGYPLPLMNEIEKQFAVVGWVRDTTEDIPPGVDRDLEHAADIELGDTLVKHGKLDEAVALYRRTLGVRKIDLAKDGNDRRAHAELYLVAGRIGCLAWQFLLAGKFAEALACAHEALGCDPYSTSFNLYRAHALMFLGCPDEARVIYFEYHGKRMSAQRISQDAIKEHFEKLRKAGRLRPLMNEVESRFSVAIWHERLDGNARDGEASLATRTGDSHGHSVGEGPQILTPAPAIRPNVPGTENSVLPLNEREDLESGNTLLSERRFDDAFEVYKRRIKRCDQMLANGMHNMQARDDRHLAVNKISEIALGYVLAGQYEKALNVVDYALSVVPSSSFANVRRAHTLMFLGNENEARDLYLRHRREKMTPEQTGESVILQDFELMRKCERANPLMDEIEALFGAPKPAFQRRTLIR